MLGKRLIKSGADAAAGGFIPSEHFETVTYTGNGGTQRIGGYINRGGLFNGSSSKIDLPNNAYKYTSFTVSLFAHSNDWTQSNTTFYSFYDNDGTNGGGFIGVNNDVLAFFGAGGTSSPTFTYGTTTLTDNTWYHVLLKVDGTSVKVYLNGTEEINVTLGSNFSYRPTHQFTIGARDVGVNTYGYFNGKIDQLRIFNIAVTDANRTTLGAETYASSTVSTTDIFNDNSGVALYQLDGNANDTGTNSGAIDSGQSAVFNDTSSYINISSLPELSTTRTVALWVNSSTVLNNDRLFGSVQSSNYFNISFGPNNNISAYTGGTPLISANNSILQNVWYHIALVANGTTGKLYINGQEVVSTSITSHTINPTAAYIGTNEGVVGVQIPAAYIDDVRVYSSALSATDIGYLASNDTLNIPTSNLVAYYDLDGDANDSSGNAYNGTATNITYTGPAEIETFYNGTATNVTYQEATKFQPDLVWIKDRGNAENHYLIDSVRGLNGGSVFETLYPNLTNAQVNDIAVTSLDSNGFTLGSGLNGNVNGESNVAWCWKAGGSAVSNTNGSITSQVSANQDAGFSIVKYTGTDTGDETVGHGLLQKPELVIYKNLDEALDWSVYSAYLTTPEYYYLKLNSTDAQIYNLSMWNGTDLTSSVLQLGSTDNVNSLNKNHIAYCFHSVEGFSKIGTYTGTGVAGNAIVTGFEPAFLMVKNVTDANDWIIVDNERSIINPRNEALHANTSNAEYVNDIYYTFDFLSNGFKCNGTTGSTNTSGKTYIYLAIAADPDTTTPVVENSFDVVTYTGNGGTQDLDFGFKPDLVWIKNRSNANPHSIQDTVIGDFYLRSNATDAAAATGGNNVSSFNSNGITVKDDTNGSYNVNGSVGGLYSGAAQYVAWVWKAGDHDDNLPQINTEGSIDSIVSVNAAAGFSIVKYTSNGSYTSSDTIGHGLSQAPDLVIWKPYSGTTSDWFVQYQFVDGSVDYLLLNAADAKRDSASTYLFQSNVLVNYAGANGQNVIAYCFHSVSGYQKIGSYTGNKSLTGPTVTTGFRPRFVLIKNVDSAGNSWAIIDSTRSTSDPRNKTLFPNDPASEYTNTGGLTFTNTGFEVDSTDNFINGLNNTHIYLAIK